MLSHARAGLRCKAYTHIVRVVKPISLNRVLCTRVGGGHTLKFVWEHYDNDVVVRTIIERKRCMRAIDTSPRPRLSPGRIKVIVVRQSHILPT